jgi:AAA domain
MRTDEVLIREAEHDSHNVLEGIDANSPDAGKPRQQHRGDDRIYARGAPVYREAGWRGVLPLPPGQKSPPPKGYIGHDGRWPTDGQIDDWTADKPPDSNLMLRVEYGIIGIDVDAYEGKTGGLTLKHAEAIWGPLPPTYRSSSRADDEVSGIRLFRAPAEMFFQSAIHFKDQGLAGIEIIQPHLRYVTAWPSIHPKTGQQYRWWGPDGVQLTEGQVPRPQDMAELPQPWIDALSKDALRGEVFDGLAPNRPIACDAVVDEAIYQHLTQMADNGEPDAVVAEKLRKAHQELTSGAGSRYDQTRDNVLGLMRMHEFGRVGVPAAMADLFRAYVLEVTDSRPRQVAEAEFRRFTEGAALLVAANAPIALWETAGTVALTSAGGDECRAEVALESPSWSPVDLTDVLSGAREPLVPSLFRRSDGQCLLYPGLVHSFHGESESGKSLIIQIECVYLVNNGQKVLYVDFESDAESVVNRLVEFGADAAAVARNFRYVQPEVRPDSGEERRAWEEILSDSYALAVIDGVTDALSIFGCSTIDNDELAGWIRTVPKQIAAHTGAAVVLVDHVTKDASTRNRWAIGGQAKMAGLTGAAYTVEVTAPLGRGLRGEVLLRIGKDRPGNVRPQCGAFSKKDRTQEAARIVIDSTGESPTVTIGTPVVSAGGDSLDPQTFRPTRLMQRASEVIERQPGELTKNKVAEKAGGKKQHTLSGIDILLFEGYLSTQSGRNGYPVYTSEKPYRETEDPESDRYAGAGNA